MNNIYVDELPKNCEKCPCYSYSEGFCNCECWYQKYGEIKDVAEYTQYGLKENERPADCPLKPLSDRLAEERKKVCDELRRKAEDKYFEIGEYGEVPCGWVISEERLQQVERGTDD